MKDVIYEMKKEMLRRKYSLRTIGTYCWSVQMFLRKLKKDDLRKVTKADVKEYLNNLNTNAGSTINVHLNALKFMMEEILHRNCYVRIRYSKTPQRLPEYLTTEEVARLFGAIDNPKHNLMVKLLYSAGFRVSELVNVRVRDFDFNENMGWVRGGKGNKDRMFILAESIKDELCRFISEHNLAGDDFLFAGWQGHATQGLVRAVLRSAGKRAHLSKRIHPHMLRHSFATHLVNNGADMFTVQSLLGHSDVRTTMIYAHVANPKLHSIKSPLDSIRT